VQLSGAGQKETLILELFTLLQAAEALGVSLRTIYRWTFNHGFITAERHGNRWLIPASEVAKLKRERGDK